MTNQDSDVAGALAFLATAAVAIWLLDWVPFRSEFTTYEAVCVHYDADGMCLPKHVRAGPIINYTTEKQSKTVVFWTDEKVPQKYDNCAIVDVKNWSCHSSSESHQMVDGRFDEIVATDWYPHQVSKARWWWLRFLHM